MGCLIERQAQSIFVTASSVNENSKKRKIVIESRPEFAIVKLLGSKKCFPISWGMIYEAATRHNANNLKREADAEKRTSRKITK
jgi:hypothetical protein